MSDETAFDQSPSRVGARSTRPSSEGTKGRTANASFQEQGEFFNTLQEMSRDWMSRATTEVELGLKLSQRLTAAQSLPDALSAYQEWLSEEMGARTEDARLLMSHGQRFVNTGARLLSNGWASAGTTSKS